MSLIALVDADIIVHRVGYTTNEESEGVAKYRLDTTMDGILQAFKFTDVESYLSDSLENNYRLRISPDYKANRKDIEKPVHYEVLKEHFIRQWQARISFGMEADDSLGIRQSELVAQSVICSIDKDLLQIPGSHYNFVRSEFRVVEEKEAKRLFYLSVLTGDITDNIKGIYGVGPKKAEKFLPDYLETDEEYCGLCFTTYLGMHAKANKMKSITEIPQEDVAAIYKRMDIAGKLLHIKRTTEEGCEWGLSKYLKPVPGVLQESTAQMQEETIPFMEPT
jgi:5'-3' exonuclease